VTVGTVWPRSTGCAELGAEVLVRPPRQGGSPLNSIWEGSARGIRSGAPICLMCAKTGHSDR
jgi:hypothetical protein